MIKRIVLLGLSVGLFGCSDDFQTPNYEASSVLDVEKEEKEPKTVTEPTSEDVIDGIVIEVLDGNHFRVEVKEDSACSILFEKGNVKGNG